MSAEQSELVTSHHVLVIPSLIQPSMLSPFPQGCPGGSCRTCPPGVFSYKAAACSLSLSLHWWACSGPGAGLAFVCAELRESCWPVSPACWAPLNGSPVLQHVQHCHRLLLFTNLPQWPRHQGGCSTASLHPSGTWWSCPWKSRRFSSQII